MHVKTINFRLKIKGLKNRIQNFNRVPLKGFANYKANFFFLFNRNLMKNSKKMVEKAQRNKYERDRRRREFGYKVSYFKFITIGQ